MTARKYGITTKWIDQRILKACSLEETLQQFKIRFFPELIDPRKLCKIDPKAEYYPKIAHPENKLTSLNEIIQILQEKKFPQQNIKENSTEQCHIQTAYEDIILTYDGWINFEMQTSYFRENIRNCSAEMVANMILRTYHLGQMWKEGNMEINQRYQNREKTLKEILESPLGMNTKYTKLFEYAPPWNQTGKIYLARQITQRLIDLLNNSVKGKQNFSFKSIKPAPDIHIVIEINKKQYELIGYIWHSHIGHRFHLYGLHKHIISLMDYTIQETVEIIMNALECESQRRESLPAIPYLANIPTQNTLDTVCAKCHALMTENSTDQLLRKKETIIQLIKEYHAAIQAETYGLYAYLGKNYFNWIPIKLANLKNTWGLCWYPNPYPYCHIEINCNLPFLYNAEQIRETLIHELTHTLYQNHRVEFAQKIEETMYNCGLIDIKGLIIPLRKSRSLSIGFTGWDKFTNDSLTKKLAIISKYINQSQILESLPLIDVTKE